MRLRTLGLTAGALAALVVLCSTPAAAQSVNRNLVRDLNTQLLYVALPLVVFVEVILLYAVVRFRDNPDPRPTIAAPSLEITWTAATAIILVFVGVSAYAVLGTPYFSPGAVDGPAAEPGANGTTVEALAYRYAWQFRYPEENVTTRGVLVVPADREVVVRVTSADVLHSLFVPRLGVKQDAFPGQYNLVRTRVHEPGRYRAYCAELCGEGHARMRATVVVVPPDRFEAWLAANAGAANVTDVPSPTGRAAAAGVRSP